MTPPRRRPGSEEIVEVAAEQSLYRRQFILADRQKIGKIGYHIDG